MSIQVIKKNNDRLVLGRSSFIPGIVAAAAGLLLVCMSLLADSDAIGTGNARAMLFAGSAILLTSPLLCSRLRVSFDRAAEKVTLFHLALLPRWGSIPITQSLQVRFADRKTDDRLLQYLILENSDRAEKIRIGLRGMSREEVEDMKGLITFWLNNDGSVSW